MAIESVGGGSLPMFNPEAQLDTSRVRDTERNLAPTRLNALTGVFGVAGSTESYPSLFHTLAAAFDETRQVTGSPDADLAAMGIDPELLRSLEPGASMPQVGGSATPSLKSLLPNWAKDLDIRGKVNITEDGRLYQDTGFVYWDTTPGSEKTGSGEVDFVGGAARPPDLDTVGTPEQDKVFTIEKALNQPYLWEMDEVKDAMDRMRAAGIPVETFDQMTQVWDSLVGRAAQTFMASRGNKKLTPWDVLDLMREEQGLEPLDPRDTNGDGSFGPGDAGYNGTKTTTHKSVTDLSEGQAWSVLQSTVSSMLGRDPSDGELRDFTHRMNRMAASNPSISRTITQYKDGEAVGSTTRSSTGFTGEDAAMAAYERAQNDPDYAEFTSATTYFNALQSALGPIGGA